MVVVKVLLRVRLLQEDSRRRVRDVARGGRNRSYSSWLGKIELCTFHLVGSFHDGTGMMAQGIMHGGKRMKYAPRASRSSSFTANKVKGLGLATVFSNLISSTLPLNHSYFGHHFSIEILALSKSWATIKLD